MRLCPSFLDSPHLYLGAVHSERQCMYPQISFTLGPDLKHSLLTKLPKVSELEMTSLRNFTVEPPLYGDPWNQNNCPD